MKLVRGAWKLLVGIKDALVLVAMLLFFGALFAALANRPGKKAVGEGALVLNLDGTIVEQPEEQAPFAALTGQDMAKQYRLRDVVRAIDTARTDSSVKALVLDLDRFGGGYPAAIQEVGDAIGRVRQSGKPVLAYATGYTDRGYMLAANASEIWVHPMGGTLFSGLGGNQLYYKGLLDKLGVTTHVYKVGKFKSAVEPYIRTEQSPEAKEALTALYGSLFSQWQEAIKRARPKAQVAQFLTAPDQPVLATGGDIAKANLNAGIVDKLGDRTAFGKRVAEIVGSDRNKPAGEFKSISLATYIDAHPVPRGGDKIGVVTVAGEIVDGKAKAGTAGGDTIAEALLKGLARDDLKALVVRVDSPGGSALASERIRLAVMEAKKKGLPVVVSMGGLAASGGYWVSTAGDTIFAEPSTVTGSIGIFGLLPTFENTLAKAGLSTDGVKTTPLSGQPDVLGGTNPTLDAILQASIENGYRQFVSRVSAARKLTPQRVDEIGQGRVWDGGTARQLGLVDRFGTLSDAIAEAARRAKIDPKDAHAVYLEKEPSWAAKLASQLGGDDDDEAGAPAGDAAFSTDVFGRAAADQRAMLAQALGDVRRMAQGGSIQARCLECGGLGPSPAAASDARLLDLVLAKLGLTL